jgi:hypothetical protein
LQDNRPEGFLRSVHWTKGQWAMVQWSVTALLDNLADSREWSVPHAVRMRQDDPLQSIEIEIASGSQSMRTIQRFSLGLLALFTAMTAAGNFGCSSMRP